jgi:two-component system sensor histidine kinase CreC
VTGQRNRIFVMLLLVYAAGIAFLLYRVLADLDPRYRESAEESLVETAQVMASLVEQDVKGGRIDTTRLAPLFQSVYARPFEARIFSVSKQQVDLRLYLVDASGRVVFDSRGQQLGADFSRWRDVVLALRGEYGARTSGSEGQPHSAVMYVSAPVRAGTQVVGAVSVAKPVQSFGQFVDAARRKTLYVGLGSVVAGVLLAVLLSVWMVRPFGLIADYARYVRRQRRLNLRRLARHGVATLRAAFDEMRDALAGRLYVTDYVQTLTHELKSPLSAIRGAAELLQEPGMPAAERERFLANIQRETQRIQEMVDRMLELAALEARHTLGALQSVTLAPLLEEVAGAAQASAAARQLRIEVHAAADVQVEGDPFLLRRAVSNLLDNALDFAPAGSAVVLELQATPREARITVRDAGPGLPEYAQGKVFEKFYSLARPHSGKKGTGLGLAFVREIATLHHGHAALANAPEGGALATFTLPRLPRP